MVETKKRKSIEDKLYDDLGKYFDNIVVLGNKKDYLSLLLNSSIDLPCDIDKIIKNIIGSINTVLTGRNPIKKWKIVNKKFRVGYEITPNFKLRRKYINKNHKV